MSDRLITTGERFPSVYDADHWRGALKPLSDAAAAELAADLELLRSPRTYSITRSNFGTLEVVETGLVGFGAARDRADELQKQYNADNPKKTYWTRDYFAPELERGDQINAALVRMRIRRCRGEIA